MSTSHEPQELIDGLCRGDLNDADFGELESLLNRSDEARRQYVERMWLESALRSAVDDVSGVQALRACGRDAITRLSRPARRRLSGARSRDRLRKVTWSRYRMIVVGCLAVLFCAKLFMNDRGQVRDVDSPVVVDSAALQDAANEGEIGPADVASPDGTFAVGAHGLRLGSADDGFTICFESGEYRSLSESGDASSLEVVAGVVGLSLADYGPSHRIQAGPLSVSSDGASFGVSCRDAAVRIAVFDGEVVVRHTDPRRMRRPVRLTRGEGMELLPDGSLITAVIGGHQRFASVRAQLPSERPRLGNGQFSYPVLPAGDARDVVSPVPAGWTLVSHPVANADLMIAEGGLEIDDRSRNQFAYCDCEVQDDGRTAYTSLYQAAGLIEANSTVRLSVETRVDQQAGYRVALYAGEAMEGPDVLVAETSGVLGDNDDGVRAVVLNEQIPEDSPHLERTLFVVLSARPGDGDACHRVYFDNVHLSVIEATE